MNEQQKKAYLAWFNDAHAMEEGLVSVLEKQVKDTEDEPAMQAHIKEHLEETKNHAKLVESCIERLGEKPSGGKDLLSKASAAFNGLGMNMMSDKEVKNVHSSYAAEHFEIATYTALMAAADEYGDDETSDVCSQILKDEIDMANWLLEQLPSVVTKYLAKEE